MAVVVAVYLSLRCRRGKEMVGMDDGGSTRGVEKGRNLTEWDSKWETGLGAREAWNSGEMEKMERLKACKTTKDAKSGPTELQDKFKSNASKPCEATVSRF